MFYACAASSPFCNLQKENKYKCSPFCNLQIRRRQEARADVSYISRDAGSSSASIVSQLPAALHQQTTHGRTPPLTTAAQHIVHCVLLLCETPPEGVLRTRCLSPKARRPLSSTWLRQCFGVGDVCARIRTCATANYPSDGRTHERSPIGVWAGGGRTAVCSVASRNWLRFAATPTRERVYGILVVVVYCGCGAWYYNR